MVAKFSPLCAEPQFRHPFCPGTISRKIHSPQQWMPSPGSRQFVGLFFSEQKLLPQNPRNLSLAGARVTEELPRATLLVLVQSEMEKNIFPLVNIPPVRGGDFQDTRIHRPMPVSRSFALAR
jgi:hypothetical protein